MKTRAEAFYTGGGIYISAKYIAKHYYIAIDNSDYSESFAVYDDRLDDELNGFCCQGFIGVKFMHEFDPDDWNDYMDLSAALNAEMNY